VEKRKTGWGLRQGVHKRKGETFVDKKGLNKEQVFWLTLRFGGICPGGLTAITKENGVSNERRKYGY